jgi:uncharacterized protein YqeY
MSLQSQIQEDATAALKARDAPRREALAYLVSELQREAKEQQTTELADADAVAVLQKQLKQREEALAAARQANRANLIARGEYEIALIRGYLPLALSEEDTAILLAQVVSDVSATTMRDMGRVIAEATAREPGVDKTLLARLAKTILTGP